MRYFISRSSILPDDVVPPVEGAERVTVQHWECRAEKTPEEFATYFGVSWFAEGTQHGEWESPWGPGMRRLLARRDKYWAIDIPDLLAFAEEHGPIILTVPDRATHGDDALPAIEIYDDFRE